MVANLRGCALVVGVAFAVVSVLRRFGSRLSRASKTVSAAFSALRMLASVSRMFAKIFTSVGCRIKTLNLVEPTTQWSLGDNDSPSNGLEGADGVCACALLGYALEWWWWCLDVEHYRYRRLRRGLI